MRPGEAPYRRGIHETWAKAWTIRQLAGSGSPAETNERIRYLLSEGATGVSLLFDVPTIALYDSDEPESAGMVGVVGVPVDTIDDMDAVFRDIDLGSVSVSLVTHYPTNTAVLFGMYLALARRRGVSFERLRGSTQNDAVMEEVVRSGGDFIPPAACFAVQHDNVRWICEHLPKWNPATFNGYNLREYGAGLVLESAVAIANALETSRAVPGSVDRLAFFWCVGDDFFREIARLRAARQVWYELTGSRLRCHCQTSGLALTREEPHNNIVRSAYHALAAVLGGCQSLHVDAWDEAYRVPTAESSLVALRTQQVLQLETGVMVPDPLGGAAYLEELTDQLADEIRDQVEAIMRCGLAAMVQSGELERECRRGQLATLPKVPGHRGEISVPATQAVGKTVCRKDLALTAREPLIEWAMDASADGATVGQMRREILDRYGRWQR